MYLRQLHKEDRDSILELIRTRIDTKPKTSLSLGVHGTFEKLLNLLQKDDTYNNTHHIFGLIDGNYLDTIMLLTILPNLSYGVNIIMSRKDDRVKKIVSGYNENSTAILEYGVKEMESRGYFTCYSAIPNHPKWKRSDKNPALGIRGTYNITEMEVIPAGEMPKDSLYRSIISSPYHIDRVVRRMRKKIIDINMI